MDLSDSIIPKSDQLNADDLIGGPQTYTVREVKRGNAEQPIDVLLVETDRAYRPSKSMRRVLVAAWGKEGEVYASRKLTLYRDPEVKFGGQKVGGIKISHLSHIDAPLSIALTETRGSRKPHRVDVLSTETPTRMEPTESQIAACSDRSELQSMWRQFPSLRVRIEARVAELDSRQDATPAPAVEEEPQATPGGVAPVGTGGVPDTAGASESEQLPLAPVGPSVLNGARARLRGQAIAVVQQEFERLLGTPLNEDEVNWWSGVIVGHPVTGGADLDTDDLRKLQARLERLRNREQLEALNQGGE